MVEPRVDPEHIGPTEDGSRLRIEWKDGEIAQYVPRELRMACPCAGCVDEMSGVRTLRPEHVPVEIYPTAIHYVGRYVLHFVWSDTEATEIYPYAYLRELWDEGQAS